jgi:hypothetical protein
MASWFSIGRDGLYLKKGTSGFVNVLSASTWIRIQEANFYADPDPT